MIGEFFIGVPRLFAGFARFQVSFKEIGVRVYTYICYANFNDKRNQKAIRRPFDYLRMRFLWWRVPFAHPAFDAPGVGAAVNGERALSYGLDQPEPENHPAPLDEPICRVDRRDGQGSLGQIPQHRDTEHLIHKGFIAVLWLA